MCSSAVCRLILGRTRERGEGKKNKRNAAAPSVRKAKRLFTKNAETRATFHSNRTRSIWPTEGHSSGPYIRNGQTSSQRAQQPIETYVKSNFFFHFDCILIVFLCKNEQQQQHKMLEKIDYKHIRNSFMHTNLCDFIEPHSPKNTQTHKFSCVPTNLSRKANVYNNKSQRHTQKTTTTTQRTENRLQ